MSRVVPEGSGGTKRNDHVWALEDVAGNALDVWVSSLEDNALVIGTSEIAGVGGREAVNEVKIVVEDSRSSKDTKEDVQVLTPRIVVEV